MKKATTLFIVLLNCLFLFMLYSCGGNMKGWPTLDLNLDIENYNEVSIEFNMLPFGRRNSEAHFYGASSDKEIINDIYNAVDGVLYSEKTYKNIDTEKFSENVIVKFTKGDEVFVFKFYSYGVTNGYFIFDNGEIHKFHGDFVGMTYEKFKNKLS